MPPCRFSASNGSLECIERHVYSAPRILCGRTAPPELLDNKAYQALEEVGAYAGQVCSDALPQAASRVR
ncbi:MAG: hypothetical protein Ct9H300mP16_11400 [Pseudomonadota bacterium]|nr:MAG: hypothetical protein Ct9H300mP16_11400 [Pseudomonadota bacterium]